MMYIHYCRVCDTIRMLSGHKSFCPACGNTLRELPISFETYSGLTPEQRFHLLKESRNTIPFFSGSDTPRPQ